MTLGRSARLVFEPLGAAHAEVLHPVLADPRVYAHLGEPPPSAAELAAEFASRAAGPPPDRVDERWVNVAVAVRPAEGESADSATAPARYIGRLEATLHGTWGEVAYLFGADHWGRGYATEAMQWFHGALAAGGTRVLWAAVAPGNTRSLALLDRLGYRRVPADEAPALGSYDAGDVCLCRHLGDAEWPGGVGTRSPLGGRALAQPVRSLRLPGAGVADLEDVTPVVRAQGRVIPGL